MRAKQPERCTALCFRGLKSVLSQVIIKAPPESLVVLTRWGRWFSMTSEGLAALRANRVESMTGEAVRTMRKYRASA